MAVHIVWFAHALYKYIRYVYLRINDLEARTELNSNVEYDLRDSCHIFYGDSLMLAYADSLQVV